jgi:hypothetical protein
MGRAEDGYKGMRWMDMRRWAVFVRQVLVVLVPQARRRARVIAALSTWRLSAPASSLRCRTWCPAYRRFPLRRSRRRRMKNPDVSAGPHHIHCIRILPGLGGVDLDGLDYPQLTRISPPPFEPFCPSLVLPTPPRFPLRDVKGMVARTPCPRRWVGGGRATTLSVCLLGSSERELVKLGQVGLVRGLGQSGSEQDELVSLSATSQRRQRSQEGPVELRPSLGACMGNFIAS